jgi:hypothetical protein
MTDELYYYPMYKVHNLYVEDHNLYVEDHNLYVEDHNWLRPIIC